MKEGAKPWALYVFSSANAIRPEYLHPDRNSVELGVLVDLDVASNRPHSAATTS